MMISRATGYRESAGGAAVQRQLSAKNAFHSSWHHRGSLTKGQGLYWRIGRHCHILDLIDSGGYRSLYANAV